MGDKKRFDRPALVELAPGVRTLGFVTGDPIDVFEAPEHVAVYLPSPTISRQLLIVPRTAITPLEASPSEIMQFIVSGGVSSG